MERTKGYVAYRLAWLEYSAGPRCRYPRRLPQHYRDSLAVDLNALQGVQQPAAKVGKYIPVTLGPYPRTDAMLIFVFDDGDEKTQKERR